MKRNVCVVWTNVHFQFEDECGTNTLECVTLTITAVCSWLWFHCRWLHISIFVTFLFVCSRRRCNNWRAVQSLLPRAAGRLQRNHVGEVVIV